MLHVKMVDFVTGKSRKVFTCNDHNQAMDICREMNRINAEASRLTGQAIRYFYSIVFGI